MKLYIAGPMTGIPQFNFPAFDAAAADLREFNHNVVSPAELDDPETRAAALASKDGDPGSGSANGETWADFLSRDVKVIADEVDAVAVLPGWEKSRGARLETFVARLCGHKVYTYAMPETRGPRGAALIEMTDDTLNCILGYGDPGVPTPGGETRTVNAKTGGEKGTKPQRMDLLPWDVLVVDVAPHYAKGAEKYAAHNWRRGYDWSLSFGAMMRHAAAFWHGEESDPEFGTPHMAAVVFHALALLLFAREFPELDDRP